MVEDNALEKYNCDFCGRPLDFLFRSRDYISGETFGVYRCPACSLGMTRPAWPLSAAEKYYPSVYYGCRKPLVNWAINFARWRKTVRADFVSKEKERSLLDVGCGDGGFISLLAKKGWRVFGTEIASAVGRGAAAPFICRRELMDCDFKEASFDLITMWHSLEHFTRPEAYLRSARRLLKNGGTLLLEVPDFGSWQASFFKDNWFHLDAPRHIFHYDRKSLGRMLEETGFRIVASSANSFLYSFFGLTQSGLNIFCRRKNFLFDLLNGKIKSGAPGELLAAALASLLLIGPIALISLAVSWAEIILKRGPILIVWARTA